MVIQSIRHHLFLFLSCISISILTGTIFKIWNQTKISTLSQTKKDFIPSDVWLVDRNHYPLESIRQNPNKRSLDWVSWSETSPSFRDILISAEDHRFYSHHGVDFIAILNSIWEGFSSGYIRGASTITMQLTGLLSADKLSQRRTPWQKFKQIIVALKLDAYWSKEEILEAYINLVSFRGELVGLRAASLGFFGKNPSGLIRDESALLVSLLRSPNSEPELIARRACILLAIDGCSTLKELAINTFSKPYILSRSRELIPVVSSKFFEIKTPDLDEIKTINRNHKDFMNQNEDPHRTVIPTSLDFKVQELSVRILREQLSVLKNQNVHDGAVLVLESTSGRVVAYVANGGNHFSSAQQVDGIQSLRQAGSTIKPFVYATAMDLGVLSSDSLLDDSQADISIAGGRVYHPKNYDHTFRGLVSVGEALGSSLNVPAVRTLGLIGENRVLNKLRELGFSKLQYDEYYGPSLALGSIDVSLWELTHSYRKLFLENAPFSKKTRDSIFNILAAPEYRRFTFGMDSLLTLPFSAAVKTGTSKDMRDNWCIGGTSKYTIGVWIGNFNGEPMWNVSGMSGAAPIWRSLMLALHPNPEPISTHYLPAEPELPKRTISRIRYPAPHMLIGLDPDIPIELQKLPIEIENPQPMHKIYLNNQLYRKAAETNLWPIKKGRFKLDLKSASGEIIDSVKFEVR